MMIKSYLEKLLDAVEGDIETSEKRMKKEEDNLNFLKRQRNEILMKLSDDNDHDDNHSITFFAQGLD